MRVLAFSNCDERCKERPDWNFRHDLFLPPDDIVTCLGDCGRMAKFRFVPRLSSSNDAQRTSIHPRLALGADRGEGFWRAQRGHHSFVLRVRSARKPLQVLGCKCCADE